jgi:hypothetical protein
MKWKNLKWNCIFVLLIFWFMWSQVKAEEGCTQCVLIRLWSYS